jgi:transposase-like protein
MGRGPDRMKRDVWTRRLREFERGDKPVAEFCDREGVSVTAFYRWRRLLAARGTDASAAQARKGVVGEVRFLPVEIVPAMSAPSERKPETQTSTSSPCVEVLLPGGARVLVPCDAPAAIRTVIAALVGGVREDSLC